MVGFRMPTRPKCQICSEPIYHDDTPYGSQPLNDIKACYKCTQEALKILIEKKQNSNRGLTDDN